MEAKGRRKRSRREDKEDRISSLPDDILHRILSFVDTGVAVRTCILSKRWEFLWRSIPYLNFCYPTLQLRLSRNSRFKEADEVLRSFTGFIFHVIAQRYPTDLVRVRLNLTHGRMDPLIAQSLVCYALQHNVRELEVDLTSYLIHPSKWVWPKSFYNSQLLTQLTLTNRHSSTYPNDIMPLPKYLGLPALNSLSLTGFIMNEDNFDPSIFSSCPNLETLNLAFTRTFHGHGLHDLKALRIHALNLKKLFFGALYDKKLLQDRCKLEIHAPKLTTFKCSGPFRIVCSTERLTCLDDVSFIMSFFSRIQERDLPYVMDTFKVFNQAKSLTLSVHIIEDLSKFPALLDGYGPLFTNLKCLKLKSNGDMRYIEKMQIPVHVLNCFVNSSTLLKLC